MTEKRRQILNLFSKRETPFNSRQVYQHLEKEMDQATIYRGLQFLEDQKFLESFIFDCSERGVERYYFSRAAGHRHFMHCSCCHAFIPLKSCPLEGSIKAVEEEYGFSVQEHYVILKGICQSCRKGEE